MTTDRHELLAVRDRLEAVLDLLTDDDPPDWDDVYRKTKAVLNHLNAAMYWAVNPEDRLPWLVSQVGQVVVMQAEDGLWYSDSCFVKPADDAVRNLFGQADLQLAPGRYVVTGTPPEVAAAGHIALTAPGAAGPFLARLDAPGSVRLDFETVGGERALRGLVYVLRRPDDQPVRLDARYVHWVEQNEAVVAYTQAAADPLSAVASRGPGGEARGFIMPWAGASR